MNIQITRDAAYAYDLYANATTQEEKKYAVDILLQHIIRKDVDTWQPIQEKTNWSPPYQKLKGLDWSAA